MAEVQYAEMRSRDELRNLFSAMFDAWCQGRGVDLTETIAAGGELPDALMAEFQPLAQQLLLTWGLAHEQADEEERERKADMIDVGSGYGAVSLRPFVDMTTPEPHTQMRPEKARQVAFMLLDAANGAEQDAMTLRWAREKLDVDMGRAEALMLDLRRYREASRAADQGDAGGDMRDMRELRDGASAIRRGG